MKFNAIFLNIISEAVQSSKLQKLIDDIKIQYNNEVKEKQIDTLRNLCSDISRIASDEYENDAQLTKKDKIILFALKDFSNSLYDLAEEKADLINEKLTKKEALEKIIFPAVEEEYDIKVSAKLRSDFIEKISNDGIRRYYHDKSDEQKKLLTDFFKRIDASNITDDDVLEASSLSELNRKTRGEFSIIACYQGNALIAIMFFDDDGTLDRIQIADYRYYKSHLNMKKLDSLCNKFIAVKRLDSVAQKRT